MLSETRTLGEWGRSHGDTQITTVAGLYRARVLAHRGDPEALELTASFPPVGRRIEDLQVLAAPQRCWPRSWPTREPVIAAA